MFLTLVPSSSVMSDTIVGLGNLFSAIWNWCKVTILIPEWNTSIADFLTAVFCISVFILVVDLLIGKQETEEKFK